MNNQRKIFRHIAYIYIIFFIAILLILAVCSTQPAYANGNKALTEEGDVYSSIDTYLQACVKNARIPAMSVSIVDKDEVLFSGNYGQCESIDTPFLLGSVSKSFTAVCIMQLAEEQKLDLSAAISTYLPGTAEGDKITVSQLLNHTSGLGEHQTLADYKIVNKQGAHHYANVNYALLGEIIESVSGTSYAEYINANLFEPLGLSHTAATFDESIRNGLIDGYTNYWGVPVKSAHKYPEQKDAWIPVPAGYLSASLGDLGKYLQMYLNGGCGVISQESIDAMLYGDTVYVDGEIPFWYGYGWAEVKEPLPEPVLRHSGLVETGTACVFILPERELAIAIAANVNDYFVTNEMMDSLGWGVVLMLMGEVPNEISGSAWVLKHLFLDLIMLAVLIIAVMPWIFFGAGSGKRRQRTARLIAVHLLLPALILAFVPVFFATPLWVCEAFVPDVFLTVVISSASLLCCGLVKLYQRFRPAASSQTSEYF